MLLTDIDIMLALMTLPFALIILGLSAILNGLGAVGGVNTSRSRTVVGAESGAARRAVSQEVSLTVLKTLQSALDRRIRGALAALILSLRNIAWPLLIMCSVVATWVAGELVERYVHDAEKTGSPALVALVAAVGLGGVAALFTVLTAALVLYSARVATNSLKFLGLIAFVVLLTFWMFSLALSGFNVLLLAIGWTTRTPFYPPALGTLISFAALVGYGALSLRRSFRARRQAEAEAAALAVAADHLSAENAPVAQRDRRGIR